MAVIDHRNKALPTEGVKYVIRNYRIRAYPTQALQTHLSRDFGPRSSLAKDIVVWRVNSLRLLK